MSILEKIRAIKPVDANGVPFTPSADWRVNGEADPFPDYVTETYEKLCMGHEDTPTIVRKLDTDGWIRMCSIGIHTAAKERIRWASRRVHMLATPEQIEHMGYLRAQLPMGGLTDDAMANQVFMEGDSEEHGLQFIDAAKKRLTWLHKTIELLEQDKYDMTKQEKSSCTITNDYYVA